MNMWLHLASKITRYAPLSSAANNFFANNPQSARIRF